MVERMVQEVRTKAGRNDKAFGGGYAEIVDRMRVAMREKRGGGAATARPTAAAAYNKSVSATISRKRHSLKTIRNW